MYLERVLLCIGVLALIVFGMGSLHKQLYAYHDRVAFAAASTRSDAELPSTAVVLENPLVIDARPPPTISPTPSLLNTDTSSWSADRRKHWLDALLGEPPPRLALLEIPSIELVVAVLDGTDEWTLNRGVGRIFGTANVTDVGNFGIAGHRDGFFRALAGVEQGDVVRLTLVDGGLRDYRIEWKRVVRPEDVWVLDQTERRALTLVTCYPFRHVGTAPKRFVVRASEVEAVAPSIPARHANSAP